MHQKPESGAFGCSRAAAKPASIRAQSGDHGGMTDDKPLIRIIPHEECIEVRASRFFYFDENPGRRSITGRISRMKAEEAAKAYAELMHKKRG
jgi:hypothetical protein